jgi:hypothetical protein
MSALIATVIDASISALAGLMALLYGFRYLGPKPGANPRYEMHYRKWVRHLKWLGPLLVVFAGIQIVIAAFESRGSDTAVSYKAELRRKVDNAISEKGIVAQQDRVLESADGFRILIPRGYTYSKPPNTPFSLVAMYRADTIATPAITVMVVSSNANKEDFLRELKTLLQKQNSTTAFGEAVVLGNDATAVTRVSVTSVREQTVVVRSNLLIASRNGKHYVANIGTTQELYGAHAAELEKVIGSFRLQ